jgi:hypothetical protein
MKLPLLPAVALLLAAPGHCVEMEWLPSAAELVRSSRALSARVPESQPRRPEVCSALDFSGVTWPDELTDDDRAALEIGLNLSGSFEGADGWANLSDNFDGQGVSLGLLNQNLGQGSLQPMLIRLRDDHPGLIEDVLADKRAQSLLDMLSKWESSARLGAESAPLSSLDEPGEIGAAQPTAANHESVKWALANIYDKDGRFLPEWKSGLLSLANTPEFVSLQIAAAVVDHDRALAAEERVGVRELRAYLFLFDIQVQNGGLYPSDFDDYAAYLRANPGASDTDRLEKMLELRLRHVRKKYREDVRARKLAVIHGTGKVHGENRDLPAQYCYDGAWPYR